jgi:hypothetical protein
VELMVGGCEDLALHDGVNADCGVETWRRARVAGSGSSETIFRLRHTQHISPEEHSALHVVDKMIAWMQRILSLLRPPRPNTCRFGFIGQTCVPRTEGLKCCLL